MSSKENSDSCGDVPPEELRKIANKERTRIIDKCVKCKTEKSNLIFRRESTCWKCFEQQVIRKFRAQLNLKQKNRSEPVFISFSGGPSSRALIEILHECIAGRNKASAYFEVKGFIHIDEGSVLGLSKEEKEEKERVVRSIAEKYGSPLHFVCLEEVFSIPNLLENLEEGRELKDQRKEGGEERLKLLFSKAKTNTAREDLLFHLRNLLIAHTAKINGVEKVLLGTSANRMATTLISLVCKGRGFNVPQEIGNESKFEGIAFGFPMRDLLLKEISIYNRFKGLEGIFVPTLDTKTTNPKFSIDHLTEAFVEELQVDFNHTVHTLLRSSGKLTMPNSGGERWKCSLCSGSLTPLEAKAARECSLRNEKREKECCGGTGCSSGKNEECRKDDLDLSLFVCGGCKRVLSEVEEDTLPSFVRSHAEMNSNSFQLREKIKDFIIGEE